MKTSISDTTDYVSLCRKSITNEDAFNNFKNNAAYTSILEHVTYELGKKYLEFIEINYPYLLNYLDLFKENDKLGNPTTFHFKSYGKISPTTLRYVKILGDLIDRFSITENTKIVEIGAGYGGQCLIINKYVKVKSYTIFDLPDVTKLQKKYLNRLNVDNIQFHDMSKNAGMFDLCISNYAFSECSKEIQKSYLDNVISQSHNGYMICNFINHLYKLNSYTKKEMLTFIENGKESSEIPLTFDGNALIWWKNGTH